MDDHIITLQSWNFSHGWHMTIDLKELVASAGDRVQEPKEHTMVTSVPISRARKLLRLIKQYGTEADLEKCDRFFTPIRNEKLYKIWREIR